MSHEIVSLHAYFEDGDVSGDGYLSRPVEAGPWPSVLVLHEWWGLNEHFREITRRLATEGFAALAVDLYDGDVTTDHDEAARLKASLPIEETVETVLASTRYLRDLPYTSRRVGTLGYCMGGGLGLLALTRESDVDAAVLYYPSMFPDTDRLRDVDCPVLLHWGTEDHSSTPESEVERITEAFEAAGTPFDLYEYEGAGHAFASELSTDFYVEEATETAWPRTVEFFHDHLDEREE